MDHLLEKHGKTLRPFVSVRFRVLPGGASSTIKARERANLTEGKRRNE